jgi:nucleotide-binding universal stress UspA family protein
VYQREHPPSSASPRDRADRAENLNAHGALTPERSDSMFEWILVPVNLAEREMRGVEVARRLATREGARIALVYVEDRFTSAQEKMRDGMVLRRLAEPLWDAGVEAYYGLEVGRTETTLADVTQELRPDLVVVAPPAHEGLDRLLHRSITLAMLAQSPAPVLIWPPYLPVEQAAAFLSHAESRIVAPLDGSTLAEGALPVALSAARAYGRPLLLVRVVAERQPQGAGADQTRRVGRDEAEAIDYVAAIWHRLQREVPGVAVEYAILSGKPAAGILSLGHEDAGTSLVVMSTHGRTGLERVVVGSVAADVVRGANVPVLVVPPAANQGWTGIQVERRAPAQCTDAESGADEAEA